MASPRRSPLAAEIDTVKSSVRSGVHVSGGARREGPVHLEGHRLVHDRLVGRVPASEVRPLRYFGEDLVAYRDESGGLHVLSGHCRHLGAHIGHGGKVVGDCSDDPNKMALPPVSAVASA